jgi:hypothetical protein
MFKLTAHYGFHELFLKYVLSDHLFLQIIRRSTDNDNLIVTVIVDMKIIPEKSFEFLLILVE